MQRKFKGIWIPASVWLSDTLTLQEKVFLVEIESLSANPKGCYASNNYFARFFKVTPSRVSQVITSLKKKNMIEIEYKYEGKQCLERRLRVVNKLNRGIEKNAKGYLENAKGINTVNNTKGSLWEKQGFKSEKEYDDYMREQVLRGIRGDDI